MGIGVEVGVKTAFMIFTDLSSFSLMCHLLLHSLNLVKVHWTLFDAIQKDECMKMEEDNYLISVGSNDGIRMGWDIHGAEEIDYVMSVVKRNETYLGDSIGQVEVHFPSFEKVKLNIVLCSSRILIYLNYLISFKGRKPKVKLWQESNLRLLPLALTTASCQVLFQRLDRLNAKTTQHFLPWPII